MIRHFLLGAAGLLASTGAMAADTRIRTLPYNPDEVVRITGRTGIQSTIEFGADERIENVALGDSSAWQVTPNRRATLVFLKPLVSTSHTNMTVITDRRTYMFDLVASGKGGGAIYALKFSYPREERLKAEAELAAAAKTAPTAPSGPPPLTAADLNFSWEKKGFAKLLPSRVFDDGTSLYLSWSGDNPLPAILTTSEDKREAPLNYRVDGNYIVISPLPANLLLRYGNRTAAIWPGRRHAPAPAPVASQPVRLAPAPARTTSSGIALASSAPLNNGITAPAQTGRPAAATSAVRQDVAPPATKLEPPQQLAATAPSRLDTGPTGAKLQYPGSLFSNDLTGADHE